VIDKNPKGYPAMPPNNALVLTLPASCWNRGVGGLSGGACASSVGAAPSAASEASVACPGNAAQRQPLDSADWTSPEIEHAYSLPDLFIDCALDIMNPTGRSYFR
jgi:hypothetical protein